MAAPCFWFADASSIKQFNTAGNYVSAEVALGNPRRLVMNDNDCSVWALRRSNGRLLKYDETGAQVRNVSIATLEPAIAEVLRVRLDPYDNSLWVTGERRIAHLDADASALLASFNAPAEIWRFRIGLDQKLWVLGKRKLWRFNRQGALMEERILEPVLQGEARNFAVDELRQTIWIAGDSQIAKLDTGGSGTATVVAQFADGITAFALDPVTGRIWFARPGFLAALNPDGSLFEPIPLGPLELPGSVHKLAFDPASGSLLAGFNGVIGRFDAEGGFVTRIQADDYDDEAIGVPPFRVRPRVTLQQPPEDGLVNRRRPTFELRYSARCNGRDCEVPQDYLSSLDLASRLNGTGVGSSFAFDAASGIATFRPENPLPQGPATFTAQLTDRYAHKSNAIETTITVDSIAPAFGSLKPPAGSVLDTPSVALRGTVGEPGITVTLENAQAQNPQGANPQTPQAPDFRFRWELTLQPGDNALQLSAIDAAGNVTTRSHPLVLGGGGGGGPPAVAIQAPAAGALVADDMVIVSGTWSGPIGTAITVNGVIASLNSNLFFATVPLVPGPNTLSVILSGPAGQLASTTVEVTSSGPSATRVVATPQQGFAPLEVVFTVTSDVAIEFIEGNYAVGQRVCNSDGCFEPTFFVGAGENPSFTYTQPGSAEAVFNIRRTDGTTITKTVRISVQGAEQVDQQLRQIWSGFTAALATGDKARALAYFNTQAKEAYGPIFDDLQPIMPQVAASFSALQTVTLDGEVAEYAINRTINGIDRIFFVYFVRDFDGVWRLDSM